jgi:SsrA-binding protein
MKIVNKKAKFNYKIKKSLEAGIVLTGAETTCAKKGSVNLQHSYAKIIKGQAYLINAIFPCINVNDKTRTKKLLLHKSQIYSLLTEIKAKKLTLIPTKMYTSNNLIKVELALAKGKKRHDKKKSLKQKDVERAIKQALKDKY